MKKKIFIAILLLIGLYTMGELRAAEYALVSKSLDDINFQDTAAGCNKAAAVNGDTCVHIGPTGPADARLQSALLKRAARSGRFSGFAVSVVLSAEVAKVVRKEVRVPVIAFDSPFAPEDGDVSRAYVGTDNVAFGRDLAGIAKGFRPEGGRLFLMGDLHDPNLAQRISGVRGELAGKEALSPHERLSGQNGWREFPRSPWNSGDQTVRAIEQVSLMLETDKPDVFISVGHWPVLRPGAYRNAMAPFAPDLASDRHIMICGVGKITPEIEGLLSDRLVHGLISIDFFEIGVKVYQTLHALSRGRQVPARIYTPNLIRTAE